MRVPVIPGFNDDVIYDIIDLACFLNVKEINLLPYHSLMVKINGNSFKKNTLIMI